MRFTGGLLDAELNAQTGGRSGGGRVGHYDVGHGGQKEPEQGLQVARVLRLGFELCFAYRRFRWGGTSWDSFSAGGWCGPGNFSGSVPTSCTLRPSPYT